MSLERKDVRAKLDPDMHEALSILADHDRLDIGEFVELALIQVIQQRFHDASVLHEKIKHLGITGNPGASAPAQRSIRKWTLTDGQGRRTHLTDERG